MRMSPEQRRPEYRHLRIFAVDPMVARGGDHQVTVRVCFEELPLTADGGRDALSFRGRRLEVVDVDASGGRPVWLKPVDLDDGQIAMQHGLEPSESDPQFHQQMVYAVALRTLEQFDRALGRVVYLRGRRRLRLVPHAFRGSNAFYHPALRAVLFGYFRASADSPGENMPGQTIFTCLSHDIIAHEVTHAVVDRLRPFFSVATNPHVRAFHEAFADIVAVFQRLTYPDLVQRALQAAPRGDLAQSKLLSSIAAQFGQGLGVGEALRSALDQKTRMQDARGEHQLGAVLLAAVFEGFLRTHERRTADLLRIATGGTGVLPQGALHPDLVSRLTAECVRTAQSVLTMCIRAFDYLPPADVTFGAFLRALVTADWELNPLDEAGLRAAIIEACRLRGIFAADAGSLAVSALLLDRPARLPWARHQETFQKWVDLAIRIGVQEQRAGTPDDDLTQLPGPTQLPRPPVLARPETGEATNDVDAARELRQAIERWAVRLTGAERKLLGLSPGQPLGHVGFHPSHHLSADGTLGFGLVVQLVELQTLEVAGTSLRFPAGATLVIDVNGRVRFVIRSASAAQRRQDLEAVAGRAASLPLGWPVDGPPADPFAVDYRGLHEGRSR